MSIPIEVINSLKSLPCFTEIQAISLLANGLSQTAIKVTTASQVFFAKKLNDETAHTEVSCALFFTRKGTEQDTKQPLSPSVIYHDQRWLVTEFINGITLAESQLNNELKTSAALVLMAKLHQLPTAAFKQAIAPLDPTQSVKYLLTNPSPFLAQHRRLLDKVTKSLSSHINRSIESAKSPSVLCHGDINFTNILLDVEQGTWLIDFECAHLAPVEFDLAMFIAINNIADGKIAEVINDYGKLVASYQPNKQLLYYFILYSFYINGLWYFDNINELESDNLLYTLAIEQWSAFDRFATEHSILLPKLMSVVVDD
ncbi:phosphotransferase [Colwellia piezophila]|uniref:phosphotransferase n=1 Tax=Colwellia piezophila TaxID=211668 RepID=UPI000370637B|nr:phosphotransferase [Colwellia piezophila]